MSGFVARVRAFLCKSTLSYTNSVCAVAHYKPAHERTLYLSKVPGVYLSGANACHPDASLLYQSYT